MSSTSFHLGELEEHERRLRPALREYEVLLREYLSLQVFGESVELKEKRQELLAHAERIAEKQKARNEQFSLTIDAADYFDQGNAYCLSVLGGLLRSYRRNLSEVPTGIGDARLDEPFIEERWFCQDAVFRLEEYLKQHNVRVDPEPVVSARGPQDQFKNIKDKVLQMQREMEEELKSSPPEMHQHIKRIYRKAIDALLEGQ